MGSQRERMLPGSGYDERCILFVEVVVLTVVARACTTPSIVSLCIGALLIYGRCVVLTSETVAIGGGLF